MQVDNIKKQIKIAQDSVKELDEPYKLETYKIILTKTLESPIPSGKVANTQNNDKDVSKNDNSANPDSSVKKLAGLCGVDEREIFDVLDIENGEIVLKKILEGKIRNQQIEGTQLILLGYEFGLGIKKVDSKTLKTILKDAHIEDEHGNFSTAIQSRKDLFTISTKKNNQYTYSLNANKGRNSAIELLRMYAKGETKED